MNRSRLILWAATSVLVAIAALVNLGAMYVIGFELLSFTMVVVVPVGAALLFAIPSGGFYLGARASGQKAGLADLLFLMAANVGVLVLSLVFEYIFLVGGQHRLESFGSFVAFNITEMKHAMYMRGMPTDAPPVAPGAAGWVLLLIKVAMAMAIAKTVQSSVDGRGSKQWESA